MMDSMTGRGYVQGDSYSLYDAAREEQERRLIREREATKRPRPEPQSPFTGVDDLHKDPDDPNFGDYNIPTGGNHP